MSFSKRSFLSSVLVFAVALAAVPSAFAASRAGVYKGKVDVAEYLVSEKLDGVRATWDGGKFVSRGGKTFAAPKWFTKDFPNKKMEGELWTRRGGFEETVSIVRRKKAHDGWKKVKYMVFDLPGQKGSFEERYKAIEKLVSESKSPYLEEVRHITVKNPSQLDKYLERIVSVKGEGVMLHKKTAIYGNNKSKDLLKYKKFEDAEAVVIAHNPGKGRFTGMLGSVTVKTPKGVQFKIGTGFTFKQRKNPPAVGETVTYKYTGFTKSGKPKHPSFWRVKEEK